jgi:lipopolysaccharide transport protein LptA
MNLRPKIKKIFKLSIMIYIFFNYTQNANADFENTLPDNYIPPKIQPTPENNNPNNTVRNKDETEKKSKQNSTQPKQDNGLLNGDFTKHKSDAPVYFKGDTGDSSRKTGILNLIGNVIIIQDDTKLTSDKAQLIGKPGSTFGSGSISIQKAIATGNVHILKKSSPNAPEIKASANVIEFLVPNRIMILKGKAKVWKEQEFINAEYMEINLGTGDINLKEPHGTIDPRATTNVKKGTSGLSNTSKDKVIK